MEEKGKKNGTDHPRSQIQKGFIDPSNTCICCQLAKFKRVKKKINKRYNPTKMKS